MVKNDKIAVKCSSLEEMHKVILANRKDTYNPPKSSDCISVVDGCHQHSSWYQNNGYQIFSFEEWSNSIVEIILW